MVDLGFLSRHSDSTVVPDYVAMQLLHRTNGNPEEPVSGGTTRVRVLRDGNPGGQDCLLQRALRHRALVLRMPASELDVPGGR